MPCGTHAKERNPDKDLGSYCGKVCKILDFVPDVFKQQSDIKISVIEKEVRT